MSNEGRYPVPIFAAPMRVNQKWPGNAADESAVGEGRDPHLAAADDSTGDDEDVVDQRAEGGQQKQAVREQAPPKRLRQHKRKSAPAAGCA